MKLNPFTASAAALALGTLLAAAAPAQQPNSATPAIPTATPAVTSTPVTTPGGTANYLPKFTGTATLGNSIIYDDGKDVGIGIIPNGNAKLDLNGAMILRGIMTVARTGTATVSKAYPSNGFDFYSSAYSSSSKALVNPYFQLESEPLGNNTATPSATFNLLYNGNGGTAAETGFYINSNGTVHFATDQTFPITTGARGPAGPTGPAGSAGPSGPTGPSGPASPQYWTSTTLLQPFATSVDQYGPVMGVAPSTVSTDYYGQFRNSLIFPNACTASNFSVNLGFESLTNPFVMETDLLVAGNVVMSCSTGFASGYGFSCVSSATYAIPAGSQVILHFTHTGTNPANVYPQVTFKCQ